MAVGVLTLHLYFPGCLSLKEKRSRLKPILARLHRQFNISVAEMDLLDTWQEAIIACAWVNNDTATAQRALQQIGQWIVHNWPDVEILDEVIEFV
ncbi:MAG: DUF503 domain-containing protein [Candidatus Methanomethylicaceae archaeon]